MKHLPQLLLLILFLPTLHLFASKPYNQGDTLYVWARSGLNIRNKPGINGNKLGKLDPGSPLIVLEKTDKTFEIKAISTPFKFKQSAYYEYGPDGTVEERPYILRGTWIKVKAGKMEGYVIDTYLLNLPAPPMPMSIKAFVGWMEGEKVKLDTTYGESCEGGDEFSCYSYEGISVTGFKFQGSYA